MASGRARGNTPRLAATGSLSALRVRRFSGHRGCSPIPHRRESLAGAVRCRSRRHRAASDGHIDRHDGRGHHGELPDIVERHGPGLLSRLRRAAAPASASAPGAVHGRVLPAAPLGRDGHRHRPVERGIRRRPSRFRWSPAAAALSSSSSLGDQLQDGACRRGGPGLRDHRERNRGSAVDAAAESPPSASAARPSRSRRPCPQG